MRNDWRGGGGGGGGGGEGGAKRNLFLLKMLLIQPLKIKPTSNKYPPPAKNFTKGYRSVVTDVLYRFGSSSTYTIQARAWLIVTMKDNKTI